MLSKEEMAVFLSLLLAVARRAQVSASGLAEALGVSHPSMWRWLAEARRIEGGGLPSITAYTHTIEPIREAAQRVLASDAERGTLGRLKHAKPVDKVAGIRALI